MKATRLILILASAVLLSGCTLPFTGGKAGIQVTANPQASVYLDGKSMGQTPVYQEDVKPGSYTVKVVSSDTNLVPWEGKVTLNSGLLTVVDRQIASDANKANGYSLYFEKLSGNTSTEVSVISFPDTVSVTVAGAPVGFTPFKSSAIAAGPNTFTFTSPGYQDKTIKALVKAGYRLVINIQLGVLTVAPTPSPTPVASVSATPTLKPGAKVEITPLPKQASSSAAMATPYIEIVSVAQGWLKVRETASTTGTELAKVNTGDKFPYKQTDTPGWYNIEYLKGSWGFVSSQAQYSKLIK